MDLTTMSPAEIDAAWFPLMDATSVATQRAEQYEDLAASDRYLPYQRERYAATAAEYREQEARAAAAEAPFMTEWTRRGGWTRAYLAITNGRGHVHSSMHCSTCNNGRTATRFFRLAQVSGLSTDEIIDQAGERACTVCYPDAPVSALNRPTRLFSAEEEEAAKVREAKRVAKAEKDAKKAAAAITNPDGTTLVGTDKWDEIKTERTAWVTAVDISFNHRAYGYKPHAEALFRIITALAAKTGRTFEEVHDEVEAKVQAKAKREKVSI